MRPTGKTFSWTSLVGLFIGAAIGTLLIATFTNHSAQDAVAGALAGAAAFLVFLLFKGLRAKP